MLWSWQSSVCIESAIAVEQVHQVYNQRSDITKSLPDRVCDKWIHYVHVLKICHIPSVANVYIAQNEAWARRGKTCVCVCVCVCLSLHEHKSFHVHDCTFCLHMCLVFCKAGWLWTPGCLWGRSLPMVALSLNFFSEIIFSQILGPCNAEHARIFAERLKVGESVRNRFLF